MRQLIIVRHGEVDSGPRKLTNRGKAQMNELAARLKRLTGSQAVRVISSPEPHAMDSAKILETALAATGPIAAHDLLLSDQDHPVDTAATIAVILTEGKTTEMLIVVTHAEHSRLLPSALRQHLFGCAWPEKTLWHGSAVCLNLETRDMRDVK